MSSGDDEPMTAAVVARLGRLARLALAPDEQERLAGELRTILGHVRSLQEVDTTGIEPTAHGLLDRLPERSDELRPGLPTSAALAQAPGRAHALDPDDAPDEAFFRVPSFVEGAEK